MDNDDRRLTVWQITWFAILGGGLLWYLGYCILVDYVL
jgi:hypothetical protein